MAIKMIIIVTQGQNSMKMSLYPHHYLIMSTKTITTTTADSSDSTTINKYHL